MAQAGRNIPPTKRKLDEARRKGEVARYRDLVCFLSLAAGWSAVLWLVPGRVRALAAFAAAVLSSAGTSVSGGLGGPQVEAWAGGAGRILLSASLVVAGPVFVMVLTAGILTTGVVFSLKPVSPQTGRLNPLAGLKKVFSPDRWFGALKDLLRLGFLAAAGVLIVKAALEILPAFSSAPSPAQAADMVLSLGRAMFLYTLLGLAPIIVMDMLYTRHAYMKKMMMTRDELRREIRETEGEPSIKGRRQRLHREIADQRMLEDVRRAAVVVVNPDHIAVALQWEEETMEAPTVTASGKEAMAERIIREARRAGIPVVRDVRLARDLAELEVGEEIPERLYEAVAEIIKILER
jgi:flagellar biosynthesis protein FlhB